MTVTCLAHGPMKRDERRKWWICGDGCPSMITDEEIARGTVVRSVLVSQ